MYDLPPPSAHVLIVNKDTMTQKGIGRNTAYLEYINDMRALRRYCKNQIVDPRARKRIIGYIKQSEASMIKAMRLWQEVYKYQVRCCE